MAIPTSRSEEKTPKKYVEILSGLEASKALKKVVFRKMSFTGNASQDSGNSETELYILKCINVRKRKAENYDSQPLTVLKLYQNLLPPTYNGAHNCKT